MRRLRLKAGWTQEQLAERARIEPRYLQDVERARTNLSVEVLVGLAEALDVDPARLLRRAKLLPTRPGRPPKP